jgi:hypothetical protein
MMLPSAAVALIEPTISSSPPLVEQQRSRRDAAVTPHPIFELF